MKLLVNILCSDIDRQLAFYQGLFGFAEITASRSAIYRALDTGASELGFNAPAARVLLALPEPGGPPSPGVFATFLVPAPAASSTAAGRVEALGGRLLKAPFQTYYGQWQTVLADPEGHACRVSCLTLPS
jgi:predicted enzyme related to lactoylglutathione lyase